MTGLRARAVRRPRCPQADRVDGRTDHILSLSITKPVVTVTFAGTSAKWPRHVAPFAPIDMDMIGLTIQRR